MRKWKVILIAKVVLGFATVGTALGQTVGSVPGTAVPSPNLNMTVRQLSNGEFWAFVPTLGFGSQIRTTDDGATGSFVTQVVMNNADQSIGGSLLVKIEGDCQSKTFQVMSVIPFSGQWRTGVPEMYEQLGFREEPEGVLRHVVPRSPVEFAFISNCKGYNNLN